jgi:hypothetical protein
MRTEQLLQRIFRASSLNAASVEQPEAATPESAFKDANYGTTDVPVSFSLDGDIGGARFATDEMTAAECSLPRTELRQ